MKQFFKGLWASIIGGNWRGKAYGGCAVLAIVLLLKGLFLKSLLVFLLGLGLAIWEYIDQSKKSD